MKLLLLIPAVLLVGCISMPVKQKFPDVPKELLNSCPDLKQVEQTEEFSTVLKTITENYSKYHECKITVDTWIEWYKLQRQVYNK